MSEEKEPDLVSKKKSIVNDELYFSAERKAEGYTEAASSLSDDIHEIALGGAYFSANVNNVQSDVDKVRVVLGKNWDYRQKNPSAHASNEKIFSNDWSPPRVFFGSPLEIEYCDWSEDNEDTGSFGLTNSVRKEKIVLKTTVLAHQIPTQRDGAISILDWIAYMKAGIITENGTSYEPIIRTDRSFYDHYHEAQNPFTPEELYNKQPAGKSFFADFKTYYNEIIDSTDFENTTGKNDNLQNSLPNIYSFLRMFTNKHLVKNDFFDLQPIKQVMQNYYDGNPQGITKNVYKDVLNKFPLETLLTLYGVIGTEKSIKDIDGTPITSKIIEKIISLSFDKVDANALFSDYFKEYTDLISTDPTLEFKTNSQRNLVRALERTMANLVFSPDSIKLLNKVDQYKKYFPFYVELEFTANLFTSIGDSMKQLFMTKAMSELALTSLSVRSPDDGKSFSRDYGPGTSWSRPRSGKYYDYASEKIYEDLSNPSTALELGEAPAIFTKHLINLPPHLEGWLKPAEAEYTKNIPTEIEGIYHKPHEQATEQKFNTADLRNYISFFRNDFSDPVNINDDQNIIFKNLFGSAFYAKILNTYNEKKRTYSDLISGVPAYTEDLFYRIEKIKIMPDGTEDVVQNVLIPNTSELDIVKYVDTQLKYSKYATYKYNVYTHRIVFGSKYKYHWTRNDKPYNLDTWIIDEPLEKFDVSVLAAAGMTEASGLGDGIHMEENPTANSSDATGPEVEDPDNEVADEVDDPILPAGAAHTNNEGSAAILRTDVAATYRVDIEPHIVLLEDKLFSTPEIFIMDRPPVPPDVNIVPYRAVNNQIKILITGAVDRYRDKPIKILNGDIDEFEKVKKAQLSTDGKVEFGSDDPVRNFQIFRTRTKPKTYEDFVLHEQISKEHFEDMILPNTKYFYTFRAIDDNGHISNPTPVYEVELIDEKGAVKPLIRLINIEPQNDKVNVKDCQKYIYLKPTPNQLYFSEDPEVDGIFSNEQNKKKYKMRLTSKGTGKKIDINFSFEKKFN